MSRYKITRDDLEFAREFLDDPVGYHSPGLQRVLNRMRGPAWEFKYVLVAQQRHAIWLLAKLPKARGSQVEIVEDVIYTDLLDAERDIFRRRWRDLTGEELDLSLEGTP